VNRILNDLELLEHETSFSVRDLANNNQSLADYGLDKPRLTVTFSSADQSDPRGGGRVVGPYTLRIGDKTQDGNRLYVLSPDGERVHVVGRSLADSLAQPIEQLRSDQIFSIPVFEVRSFNLQPAAPANLRIRLRTDGNRWMLEAPIIARASKTETVLAINGLNALRVKSFMTTPPADVVPAANPTLRISLEGNNRTETLYIGTPRNPPAAQPAGAAAPEEVEYYAQMEGKDALFTVVIPTELKRKLDNAQRELRERRLLESGATNFDPRAVTAITLAAPNTPELTLQRLESPTASADTAAWQIVRRDAAQSPQTQAADNKTIQDLLAHLSQLSAEEFLDDAPAKPDLEKWGLTGPERVITLSLAGVPNTPATKVSLEIGRGAEGGKSAYARVTGTPYVYRVDAEILHDTPVRPLDYRDRLLRDLPAASGARITGLKLTDATTKNVIFERAIPAAVNDAATKSPADAAVAALVEQLTHLRAKKFVADQFTATENVAGEERPWKYQLEVAVTLVGGTGGAQTSLLTLFLGERNGGNTQRAGSPEFNAVWELEQPFVDALWTLTYGPRDPGPAAPEPAAAAPATKP
jgi:hypothetical protein